MNQKGFIQVPLLIAILVSVISISAVATAVVLDKQGELTPFIANISQIFKDSDTQETQFLTEVEQAPEETGDAKDIVESETEQIEFESSEQIEKTKEEPQENKLLVEVEKTIAGIKKLKTEIKETEEKDNTEKDNTQPEPEPESEPPSSVVDSFWVNSGSSFSCCDNDKSCTCQPQEYREYMSDGNYSTTDDRTRKFNCSSCNSNQYCSEGVCHTSESPTIPDDTTPPEIIYFKRGGGNGEDTQKDIVVKTNEPSKFKVYYMAWNSVLEEAYNQSHESSYLDPILRAETEKPENILVWEDNELKTEHQFLPEYLPKENLLYFYGIEVEDEFENIYRRINDNGDNISWGHQIRYETDSNPEGETKSIIQDGFDDYKDGSIVGQGNWYEYRNGENFKVQNIITFNGAKALYVNSRADSVINKNGVPLSDGKQTVYVRTENRSNWGEYLDGNVQVRILKGIWGGSAESRNFIGITFKKDGHVTFYNGSNNTYVNFATYNDNEWTLLEIEWRSSDETARYKVNDEVWTDWNPFGGSGTFTDFDNVGFDFDNRTGSDGSGGVYFDSIY